MEEFKSAYPLIHNKAISPRFVTPTLKRPRLLDWLTEHQECRALVIAAGAGYGKTTLLWQWEQTVDFPCYWYKLDRNDRDWTLHISYLVEAVSQHHPGFGRRAHSILRQMGGPGSSRPGVTAFLLAEMHERLHEPCTFIIDDWQYVASVTEVRGLWNQILRDAPPTCRFIFLSRGKPHLQFARFKTHGGYAELRTDDLRLTEAEITELFRDVYSDPLSENEAAELERRTEGWAASLQLVEVSLRERKSQEDRQALIESITATSDSDLFQFLAEEVLDQQTTETRNFLLSTSILQQMTPDLAERLTGVTDGTRRLMQLEHAGLFTYRLDEARYRYHGLFRDFLERQLLEERSESEVTSLHIHAASYFETSSQWPEAIYHYLRAGLQTQAARLIARYGEEVAGEGRLGLADEWLEQLPAKTIRDNARLSLLHGETLGIRGQFEDGLAALQRAKAFFARKGDQRMQALALVKESSLFSHWGRPDDGAAAASTALEIVPTEARDIRMRIRGNLAITKSWHTRPLEETQRELMRVTAEAMELGLEHYVAIGFHNLGQIQYEMGELGNARKSLERAAEFWDQPASGPFGDNFNLVTCLLAQGEASRAADYAMRGIAATDGWPRLQAEASCGLAQVHMTAGNFAQAARALEGHVFGRRDLGASTEMVLVTYLRSKLLSAEADTAMSEAAARLRGRQLDPRQAPTTQAVLAAVEHALGACQADCADGALAKALEWRGRGAALMSAEALLIAAPALVAHNVSGGPAAVRWAIRTITELGVSRRYLYWLRRLGESDRAHRLIEARLWPDLIAHDPRTWSSALLRGGIAHLDPEARAAAIAAVEAHSSGDLLPFLAAVATPDLIASRQRILVKHADRFFVHSFGKLSVHRGGWEGPSIEIHKKRERALLGFLVAHFGESISRDTVLDALWPDTSPAAAVNNLNQTMFQLRRMLDPDYRDGVSAPYVVSGPESIELHPDLVRVDWHELTRRLRSSAGERPGPPTHPMKLAARLIRGAFLQEALYEDWSASPRQRVHDSLRGALLPMASQQSVSADLRVRLAECLVTLDEFDELAHASLARALADSGRRVAALRVVRQVTARLREEQIEPSAPLATVIRELSPRGRSHVN